MEIYNFEKKLPSVDVLSHEEWLPRYHITGKADLVEVYFGRVNGKVVAVHRNIAIPNDLVIVSLSTADSKYLDLVEDWYIFEGKIQGDEVLKTTRLERLIEENVLLFGRLPTIGQLPDDIQKHIQYRMRLMIN